jgi:predicted AAA+ superfamily ATPase
VETFGQKHFDDTVSINFELSPEFKRCFDSLNPDAICNALRVLQNKPIIAGKTLLFLDEIQDCPQAIQSLRYFKEKMPELHVIGAGSLLELALRHADYRMPVGRVSSLYLYPLSFKEFLQAYNSAALGSVDNLC